MDNCYKCDFDALYSEVLKHYLWDGYKGIPEEVYHSIGKYKWDCSLDEYFQQCFYIWLNRWGFLFVY